MAEVESDVMLIYFHRILRQTVSWDVPMSGSTPQRTKSCETNETNNRLSNISDEGQSGISTEHENHEGGAWSSDYSNSEDEFTTHDDEVLPVSCCWKIIVIYEILQ